MKIPALYATYKGGSVHTGRVEYSGDKMSLGEPITRSTQVSKDDERLPLVVVDVRGMNTRVMDDRLLMDMKFPGGDVWYLTPIVDLDDLFDVFMGDIVKVLMPIHMVRDRSTLEEIFEISDCCIPVIYPSKVRSVDNMIRELGRVGFMDVVVCDRAGEISYDGWNRLFETIGVIPFVCDTSVADELEAIGFNKIIVDF